MSDFLNTAIAQASNQQAPIVTRSTKAKEASEAIKQIAVQAVAHYANSINQGFDLLWNNPNGLSPQEVCNALGTDGVAVFAKHKATAEFLVSQVPVLATILKQVPDGYKISFSQDGNVTIVEPA